MHLVVSSRKCLATVFGFVMGGLFSTKKMRRTDLLATTKLSVEHETPPIESVLLADGFLFSSVILDGFVTFMIDQNNSKSSEPIVK